MSSDYPSLRPETRTLIENPESIDVEYKESIDGLDQRDLVSFANADGGTILVGVREEKDASGRQYGVIVGYEGSYDRHRGVIQSRANECHPPIEVEIAREFNGIHHIYRVDIKITSKKPCCTGGGSYSIRQNGQNKPIYPEQLTTMILEREALNFITQLQEAGSKFVSDLKVGQEKLLEQIDYVEYIANQAHDAAISATEASQEAMIFGDEAVGTLLEMSRIVEGIDIGIDRILKLLTNTNQTISSKPNEKNS